MNRTAIAIIALSIFVLTGCSNEPDRQSESKRDAAAPNIAETDHTVIQRNDADAVSPSQKADAAQPQTGQTEELSKLFAALTHKAQQLEAEMKHAEAAEVWTELAEKLTQTFGPEAWQTQNAVWSRDFAVRAAELGDGQLQKLRQITQLNRQAQKLISDHDLSQAIDTALQSRELLEQTIPDANVPLARQSLEIAALQAAIGDHDSAVKNYQAAIHRFHQSNMTRHPDLERAHAGLAAAALATGNVAQALANQKEATRIAGSLWGDGSIDYALQANQLGVLHHRSGDLQTALRILRASEAIRRNHLGPDHPQVGHSRFNIGVVLMDMKQYDEALGNFKQAEQILLAAPRPDWKSVSECQSKMATLYMLGGHFVPAQSMLQSALTNLKQSPSFTPDEINALQYRLAIALAKQGKYDRARPMLEQLVDVQRRTLGDHPDTLKSIQALALVMQQTRQSDAAERLNSEARRMAEALPNSTQFRR